jgi:hypothetical protein
MSARTTGGKRLVTIQLTYVDEGSYHTEELRTSSDLVDRYERLIDFLQEEPELLKQHYLDLTRLCSARVVPD